MGGRYFLVGINCTHSLCQVLFGLLRLSAEALGLVMDGVDGWQLNRGLGKGRFARVYAATETNNSREYVLKYYSSYGTRSGKQENQTLCALNSIGVRNIPVVEKFIDFSENYVLIISPVGLPILPTPFNLEMTPQLICTLLEVLKCAHDHGIVHRDVKPENIYLHFETSEVILGDWGSAAELGKHCQYEGTPLYGEQKTAYHTPSAALDLCSLVKTAFVLKQQHNPRCYYPRSWTHIEEYWNHIADTFPGFAHLITCANSGNHAGLRELFMTAFW